MLLAADKATSVTIGLILTFAGIGVIVTVFVIYMAVQIRGERQQNRAYRSGQLE